MEITKILKFLKASKVLSTVVMGLLSVGEQSFAADTFYQCGQLTSCQLGRCGSSGIYELMLAHDETLSTAELFTRKKGTRKWNLTTSFVITARSTTSDEEFYSERGSFGRLPAYGMSFSKSRGWFSLYFLEINHRTRWSISCNP